MSGVMAQAIVAGQPAALVQDRLRHSLQAFEAVDAPGGTMALRIEDHALIGNQRTAALVGIDGSIDWLCLPSLDSQACFAKLAGDVDNGRWKIAPTTASARTIRRYRGGTLVLETEFEAATGRAALIDFMTITDDTRTDLIRIIEGRSGHVAMCSELVQRVGYGRIIPWVRRTPDGLTAFAGSNAVRLLTGVPLEGHDMRTLARFEVTEGQRIAYDVRGDPVPREVELDWLKGYAGSVPVRVGNSAHGQFQLDVYGELFDVLHSARMQELELPDHTWRLQRALMRHLEECWDGPDSGIWEMRGEPRHFTHYKVMTWVAVDRAVKGIEWFGLEGPLERWRSLRERIRQVVLDKGFDEHMSSFTQDFDSRRLDASLLTLPLVGFIDARGPRMLGTVDAIRQGLGVDGLILRYDTDGAQDGLDPGEGAFLLTLFWLCDVLVLQGRQDEASALFERLLGLCNDVGLLAEEYEPSSRRQLGNFPQAFSHVGIVSTMHNLCRHGRPAQDRAQGRGCPVNARGLR